MSGKSTKYMPLPLRPFFDSSASIREEETVPVYSSSRTRERSARNFIS
jgi:hypothetical protein